MGHGVRSMEQKGEKETTYRSRIVVISIYSMNTVYLAKMIIHSFYLQQVGFPQKKLQFL